jgi:hypothetical protein
MGGGGEAVGREDRLTARENEKAKKSMNREGREGTQRRKENNNGIYILESFPWRPFASFAVHSLLMKFF